MLAEVDILYSFVWGICLPLVVGIWGLMCCIVIPVGAAFFDEDIDCGNNKGFFRSIFVGICTIYYLLLELMGVHISALSRWAKIEVAGFCICNITIIYGFFCWFGEFMQISRKNFGETDIGMSGVLALFITFIASSGIWIMRAMRIPFCVIAWLYVYIVIKVIK
jgi:hypothetical protein